MYIIRSHVEQTCIVRNQKYFANFAGHLERAMEIKANRPKVSVVMSFYKEPLQWMNLALDSILDQTFRDFEIILICDNPDYKEGIAYAQKRAEQDSRVRLIINDTNIGLTKSLNKGIRLAEGKYIARMDADDIAFPQRFEKQVEFLENNPDVSVCASDVHIINAEGEIVRRDKYKRKYNNNWYFISNNLCSKCLCMVYW